MDARAIAGIHVETWRATYAGLVPAAYLVRMTEERQSIGWREHIGRRGSRVLVALSDRGEIVGFGSCGQARAPVAGLSGEVYTLYVAQDWQNRGIGRKLLTALFEELTAAGRLAAFLWVLEGNPSRFFYEAMGGQRVGVREETFAGASLSEIAYGWPDLLGWLKAAKS